jgi:CHAD domain-containing protein
MAAKELLERPSDEACRVVALGYLDDAVAARGKLGSDGEALHDLRVALRRLRSTLRAYRASIGRPLGERQRRRLRAIVDATSEARDAEVLIGLYDEEAARLDPAERESAGWWRARLEAEKAAGYGDTEGRLDHFAALEQRLRRRLSRVSIDLQRPHRQEHALGELMEAHIDDVEDDLSELRSPDQVEEAHAARISVKRLRYLIEPFKGDAKIGALVTPCKVLQDLLGDLHDAHVAIERVRRLLAEPATPALARDGLAALAVRLELRQLRLYRVVESEWLRQDRLVAPARALAAQLRAR